MEIRTAIFHGPSGSGKDTQLDLLQNDIQFDRIGSSFVKDQLLNEDHPLAIEADGYGKKGLLYPDKLMYGMFSEYLKRLDSDSRWFFVGPVRKATQIELFDQLVSSYNRELDLFVHFTLSEESAVERMSLRWVCPTCNSIYHSKYKKEKKDGYCDKDNTKLLHREDDEPEQIAKRLAWYNKDLKPILEEYSKRGILMEIDAGRPIDVIYKDLKEKLRNYEK